MRLKELWRFPVKSLGGESLTHAQVSDFGIEGDRLWAVLDVERQVVLTAKREPKLLFATSTYNGPNTVPTIELPGGRRILVDVDRELSEWLGVSVSLIRAGADGGKLENPRNFEDESEWVTWTSPGGAWHDIRRARVSLVSEGSLGSWDQRRFRTNLVMDGNGEDDLIGQTVTLGSASFSVEKALDRCVMVTRGQPGLPRDLSVLKEIIRDRQSNLAVGLLVAIPGEVHVGDSLDLRSRQR